MTSIYVKYKNNETVYVNGREVKLDKYISKLEKSILKGTCEYFRKDETGYKYKLLKNNYKHYEYIVNLDSSDNKFNQEMNRLYNLSNSEDISKKYDKNTKDIQTNPKHIILRNLYESIKTKFGLLTIGAPFGWALSMLVACSYILMLGIAFGNPILYTPLLVTLSKVLSIISLSLFVSSCLYVFLRTVKKSIKEIEKQENNKDKSKENIEVISWVKEKEQVEKVTKSEKVSKNYVSVVNAEESKATMYLKERYSELSKERNRLIKNNGSKDRIEELTNEMKAILYRYNSVTNREDKTNTCDGPVHKLKIK